MLSEKELAEIEARANAATAPPWEYISGCIYTPDGPEPEHPDYLQSADGNLTLEIAGLPACGCCPNLTFIAHARADVPALIASHRAQGEEITRLREVIRTAATQPTPAGVLRVLGEEINTATRGEE